jgi:hypothetical protein
VAYTGVTPPVMLALEPRNSFDQPEVGDLEPAAEQEQVLRLHVQVLEAMHLVDVVERLARVAHVTEQLVPGNAGQAASPAFVESAVQAALGQFGDDDQLAVEVLETLQRQQERVPDSLDPLQGTQFLLGARAGQVAEDDLDGLDEPTRSGRLPYLAVAAETDALQEMVAGDDLDTHGCVYGHGRAPEWVRLSYRTLLESSVASQLSTRREW